MKKNVVALGERDARRSTESAAAEHGEHAVAKGSQELDEFLGRISIVVRVLRFDLEKEGGSISPKQRFGGAKHGELVAFDVHLDEGDAPEVMVESILLESRHAGGP